MIQLCILITADEGRGHQIDKGARSEFTGAVKRIGEAASGKVMRADKQMGRINDNDFRMTGETARRAGVGNLPAFEIVQKHIIAMKIRPVYRRSVKNEFDIEAAGGGVTDQKKALRHGVLMFPQVGVDNIGGNINATPGRSQGGAQSVLECEKMDQDMRGRGGSDEIVKHKNANGDRL